MSEYFVMECNGTPPIADVAQTTELDDGPWMTGSPVDPPPGVVTYEIQRKRPGNLRALYSEFEVPIVRADLLQLLQEAGVDNLQLFKAVIRDPAKRVEHKNYSAFNILGLVAAADMGKSRVMHSRSVTGVDHDFEALALASDRIPGDLLLFRLAESVNAIVVHEKVKQRIEQSTIDGMVFYASGEWSG
jgi:hypothetical protein